MTATSPAPDDTPQESRITNNVRYVATVANKRRGMSVLGLTTTVIVPLIMGMLVVFIEYFVAKPAFMPSNLGSSPPAMVQIPNWAWTAAVIIVAVAVLGAIILGVTHVNQRRREFATENALRGQEAAELATAIDRLTEQMALPSLVNLNRIILDKYHGIATEQAESSFRSSRRAMWCGFAWLLACFGSVILIPSAGDAQLLIGSLAVTGGALSAFLGRTYIHVYERSLVQLNQYFEQPLLNSYLLSAERVIGEMDDGKDDAYRAVLDRLLQTGDNLTPTTPKPARTTKIRRRTVQPDSNGVTTGGDSRQPGPPSDAKQVI